MGAKDAIVVASLHIYPVKACGGLSVTEAVVTPRGFRHDRQWMFVDERGMFVAQRQGRGLGTPIASVCLVRPTIADGTLTLTAPSMPPLTVALDGDDGVEIPVTIWDDRITGLDQGAEAEAWATEWLSRERPGRYRLVRMPGDTRRAAKLGDAEVGFNDAYPFLVISTASLADLNARLAQPLPMNRFRPNIVLNAAAAYQEDRMDHFRIGAIEFLWNDLVPALPDHHDQPGHCRARKRTAADAGNLSPAG